MGVSWWGEWEEGLERGEEEEGREGGGGELCLPLSLRLCAVRRKTLPHASIPPLTPNCTTKPRTPNSEPDHMHFPCNPVITKDLEASANQTGAPLTVAPRPMIPSPISRGAGTGKDREEQEGIVKRERRRASRLSNG